MELTAYEVAPHLGQELVVAPFSRDWIDALPEKFGRRCLPMMMANQAGWHIVLKDACTVQWDGTPQREGVTTDSTVGPHGMFGDGIATWNVVWLFRTSPGWNLLARGPANVCKDGIAPLEGLIETDWACQTFTMNWRFTRPGSVRFEAGEPICQIIPQRRHELESFEPSIRPIQSDRWTNASYQLFCASRANFLRHLEEQRMRGWEKHYHKGWNVGHIDPAPEHQRKLRLVPFTRADHDDDVR